MVPSYTTRHLQCGLLEPWLVVLVSDGVSQVSEAVPALFFSSEVAAHNNRLDLLFVVFLAATGG